MEAGELKRAMDSDPVARFRAMLLEQGHISQAALEKIEFEIRQEIEAAFEFAMSSEYPPMDETTKDVYGVGA